MSIRQVLLLSLTFLLLFTSGATLAVAAFVGVRGAEDLTRTVIEETGERLSDELDRFLEEVERDVLIARKWLRTNRLRPTDFDELNKLFQSLIERTPQLSSVLIARSDGSEYSILQDPGDPDYWENRIVRRNEWGDRALIRRWNTSTGTESESFQQLDYDPRVRPYYQTAVSSDSGDVVRWTPPYVFFVTRDPGITGGSYWTSEDGRDTTVVAFDLLLLDLSSITAQANVSDHGFAFALSSESSAQEPRVVGLPRFDADVTEAEIRRRLLPPDGQIGEADSSPLLPRADQFESVPLKEAVIAWQAGDRAEGTVSFEADDGRWWAVFRPHEFGAHTIWMAVSAPESDFIGNLVALARQVGIVALLALLLAIALATWLAHGVSRPLEALARTSERISRLDLDATAPVESRLREIKGLALEQERMRVALDSFTRYMPVEIVRRLLERGEAARIGGRRRIITILFTDIEGFTTIAEAHSAEETTEHLTEYFELILNTIRSHHGEVNQLMGDGVVAYWGAPAENPDHASDAVRAILACHARLTELNPKWEAAGKPALPTRFGMATGEVVVGNVGSPARLAYVAVGDPANLASRIEGLNRFYGTRLLVAGDTRQLAGDDFEWRHVDGVRAKGKTAAVDLYEPLGMAGAVPPDRLAFRDRYEAALKAYRARRFGDALRHLGEIAGEARDDRSVKRLRYLADGYLRTPPPDGWDGVTDFQEK